MVLMRKEEKKERKKEGKMEIEEREEKGLENI